MQEAEAAEPSVLPIPRTATWLGMNRAQASDRHGTIREMGRRVS